MAFNPFYWTRQGQQQGADTGFVPSQSPPSSGSNNYQYGGTNTGGGAPAPRGASAADTAPTPAGQTQAPQGGGAPAGVAAPQSYPQGPGGNWPTQGNYPGAGRPYRDPAETHGGQEEPFGPATPGGQHSGTGGSVFHPTGLANSFYGALLGHSPTDAMYQPNATGGGFEQGQEQLRRDIQAGFKTKTGRDLPYQFSAYDFNLGNADPGRQAYQMAHWFYGGPQHGWSPGLNRERGTYDQASQDELMRFINEIRRGGGGGGGGGTGGGGTPPPTSHT